MGEHLPLHARPHPLQTAANHLQLYSLNVSSAAVWRLPNGRDVRRVNVYLSHRWGQNGVQDECRMDCLGMPGLLGRTATEQSAEVAGMRALACSADGSNSSAVQRPMACRVCIPPICSIHLDYGPVRIADLGGDARSLLVALTNGTMQVFWWQGKVRRAAFCLKGHLLPHECFRVLHMLASRPWQGKVSRAAGYGGPDTDGM